MDRNTPLPRVHVDIIQPPGYVHSLGFLDPARYLRYQLRRLGTEVTIAKNRLREDTLNIVFGAHLGFDPGLRSRHACLFVNLEQLGPGGAVLSPDYLKLLQTSGVIDYDGANVSHYCADTRDVPLLSLGHAPYLSGEHNSRLENRPIDLLFFGSMNARRQKLISRIEACGVQVSVFDHPIYGTERDHFIRQAKAVLNLHYYESARFEQIRVQHCLSLGTAVISERGANGCNSSAFDETVNWLEECDIERFFREEFSSPKWFERTAAQLIRWQQEDPLECYADLAAFCAGFMSGHVRHRPTDPWRPRQINLGSGKDYKPGWLNLDILDRTEPDLLLDLGRIQDLPLRTSTRFGTDLLLEPGTVEKVHANNVFEHVPDLPCLMTNILTLLQEGGTVEIEVPYERAPTAWQDPTHVRAMNENSWLYYTDWFWYLGWYEHRMDLVRFEWLDGQLNPCEQARASFMRTVLSKRSTTAKERMVASTMQSGFPCIPSDLPPKAHPLAQEQVLREEFEITELGA